MSHWIGWCSFRLPFQEGGARPLGWVICLDVDRPGPWWIGSLMEKPTFTRVNLSDVRVIMTIMHVLMEELLCQVMT
jgi:hypothetical protein